MTIQVSSWFHNAVRVLYECIFFTLSKVFFPRKHVFQTSKQKHHKFRETLANSCNFRCSFSLFFPGNWCLVISKSMVLIPSDLWSRCQMLLLVMESGGMMELWQKKPGLFFFCNVHPGRLTWTIVMEVWKIIFLSKCVICRFHVNLPGCRELIVLHSGKLT